MKNGLIKLENYQITPLCKSDILSENDFQIINSKRGKVFISKRPFELQKSKFWITIYCKDNLINKVELKNNSNNRNYSDLSDQLIDKLQKDNIDFLFRCLGAPSKKTISGVEYSYDWGKVFSYFDNKSADIGIVIQYNDKYLQIGNKSYIFNHAIRKVIKFKSRVVVLIYDDLIITNNVIAFDNEGNQLWKINDLLDCKKPMGNVDIGKDNDKVLSVISAAGLEYKINVEIAKLVEKLYLK